MKKNVIALVKELENEVNTKYKFSGNNPDEFGNSAFDEKLAILSDMWEEDDKLGLVKSKTARAEAYIQLADLYKACGRWN